MEQTKRRPGRPPAERRRIPMAMRITPELRDALVSRAEATGRSITQEMELLLEQALSTEDMIGGKDAFGLLMVIGRAMQQTGVAAGIFNAPAPAGANRWLLDPYAYDQAVKAAVAVFEALRPPGEIKPRRIGHSELDSVSDKLGEAAANTAIDAIAGEEISAKTIEWAKSVTPRLPSETVSVVRSKRGGNRQ